MCDTINQFNSFCFISFERRSEHVNSPKMFSPNRKWRFVTRETIFISSLIFFNSRRKFNLLLACNWFRIAFRVSEFSEIYVWLVNLQSPIEISHDDAINLSYRLFPEHQSLTFRAELISNSIIYVQDAIMCNSFALINLSRNDFSLLYA